MFSSLRELLAPLSLTNFYTNYLPTIHYIRWHPGEELVPRTVASAALTSRRNAFKIITNYKVELYSGTIVGVYINTNYDDIQKY